MKKTPTKRKLYQKRRKKEKEEKRRNLKQQTSLNAAITATMTANNKYNNEKHHQQPRSNKMKMDSNTADGKGYSQRVYHNQHIPYLQYTNPLNSYTEGMRQWWQTYCTALQYHNEQGKQWKATCSSGQTSKETHTELLERYAEEYQTSSEEEDEEEPCLEPTQQVKCDQQPLVHHNEKEEDDIDLEYIKFLEITHKHREELKLIREAENMS